MMLNSYSVFIRLAVLLFVPLTMGISPVYAAAPTAQKAVLVTGASTGIGRNIAERLAAEGHFVFAGARKDKDLKALNQIDNIQGVRLDVTVQADIDAAVEMVKASERELYGIVNNAGVMIMGLLAELDESDLDFVFDVNVYGPYRIIKAFAPMIIESKGRITNISSLAGIASGPTYGAYSMSKHALEAFTDSLAMEMETVGVRVSAIAPGAFNSNASKSYCRRREQQNYDPNSSLFKELARDLAALCANNSNTQYPEPNIVSEVVLHALFSDDPKRHYLAVASQPWADYLIRDIIRDLVEFNRDEQFGYSRDDLVQMLDELINYQASEDPE
jgi:NAD(P)-dependent dehydrogenase (short-subunit alcohol dehydrogenase family)